MNEEELHATLTWHGQMVDMSDKPAAEALAARMLRGMLPGIKGGIMKIEVVLKPVTVNGTKCGYDDKAAHLIAQFNIQCPVKEEDVARILSLQRQGIPLYCIIGTDQAKMDLRIETIDAETGELAAPVGTK